MTENGNKEEHCVDIDIDRKDHDVIVENMRISSSKDKVDVMVDVLNRGRKTEEDVYIELEVFGAGINLVSRSFKLDDWNGDYNREIERFSFDKPDEGLYTVEARVNYGSAFYFVSKDFEVKESSSGASDIGFITGSTQVGSSGSIGSETSDLMVDYLTWGIIDFLLLIVVISGFVWLIKKL